MTAIRSVGRPRLFRPVSGAGSTRSMRRRRLAGMAIVLVLGLLDRGVDPLQAASPAARDRTVTATALVRIRLHPGALRDGDPCPFSKDELKVVRATQAVLVRSRTVIVEALLHPKLESLVTLREQEDAVSWLQDALKIRFAGEFMRISLSGERGSDLVEIVNAITTSYLNTIGSIDKPESGNAIARLESLQRDYAHRLGLARGSLASFNRVIGPKDQETRTLKEQLAVQQAADLKKELSWASIERKKVEIELELKRKAPEGVVAKPTPEELASLAQKVDFYTQYEKVLKDQVESQSSEALDATATTTRIQALQDEIQRLQVVHDEIGLKLERLRVADTDKSLRIELFEPAMKAR